MRKYDATLLVVGRPEKEKYSVRAGEGTPGLRLLYSTGETALYTTGADRAA